MVVTYFVLRQDGRDQIWRMHSNDGQARAVYESEAPVQPRFRAIAPGQFANWHPFIRGSAFLRFEGETMRVSQLEAKKELH